MTRFLNAVKTHATSMDAGAAAARWGVVQSVDPTSMTVKVTLQPENVLTDWLPIVSPMSGGGWGVIHPPVAGTQVLCLPDAGDPDNYTVLGATWNTAAMPPAGPASGELWMVHPAGATIKLTNDGSITISASAGVNVNTPVTTVSGVLTVGVGATGTFTTQGGVTVTVRDGIVTNIH